MIYNGSDPSSPFARTESGLLMPFVPVQIYQPPGGGTLHDELDNPRYKAIITWALVDTGSGTCLIDHSVARALSLTAYDTGTATTVNGSRPVNRYYVGARVICDDDDPEIFLVAESHISHINGAGMILGVDWLSNKTLAYDRPHHRFSIERPVKAPTLSPTAAP